MGPSIDRVVAVIGVLLAGAAFVPIEPSLPLARRARLLAQSGALFAGVGAAGEENLPAFAGVVLDATRARTVVAAYDDAPLAPSAAPDDPAYVLFTSGSTGE